MATADIKNTNHRFADVVGEPCTPLLPIEGFNKYPLVTLEEAVLPLYKIVPRLSKPVQVAKERAINPANDLSRDESAAIILYTMEWEPYTDSLYYILNHTLRTEDRKNLKPWFSYLKLVLTALSRLPPLKLTIYRGVRNSIPNEQEKYRIGKEVFWWGFSSCSISRDVSVKENFIGESGQKTLFIIDCLKGKDISEHSYFRKENEILLLPATKVQVVKRQNEKENLRIIYLKEIESSSSFLESVSSTEEIIALKNASHANSSISLSTKSTISEPDRYSNCKLNEYIARFKSGSEAFLIGKRFNENDIELISQQLITDKECRYLFLRESGVTSQGAITIARNLHGNKTLQLLFMSHNSIGDEGARALAESLSGDNNVTLRQLCLGHNNITDIGVAHIANMLESNKTLTHLWLPSNKISDVGLKTLAEAIANTNKTLTLLALEWNQFSDTSVDILINMLQKNRSLIELSLNSCKLSRSAVKQLKKAVKSKENSKYFKLKIH